MTSESTLQDILNRSALSRSAAEERFLRGEWPAGRLPYGYEWNGTSKRFVAVPARIAAVQAIFALYVDGELGYERIAMRLYELGYPGPGGRNWTGAQVARILGNRFYCGYIQRPCAKGAGHHWMLSPLLEPAVSEQQWDQAQAIKKTRNSTPQLSLDELLR